MSTSTNVILVDADSGITMVVPCADDDQARAVGEAAIFSDGGIDAWLDPGVTPVSIDWLIGRLRAGADLGQILNEPHVDYPHHPGTLYDCPACEHRCHCDVDAVARGEVAECIWSGHEHHGTTPDGTSTGVHTVKGG